MKARSFLIDPTFWLAMVERGVRTFAWTAAGLLGATGVDHATNSSFVAVDWQGLLITSGIAALSAVLFGIGVAAKTDGSPAINGGEKIVKEMM